MVNRIILLALLLSFGTLLHAAETGGLKDPLRPLGYRAPTVTAQKAEPKTDEWRLGAVLISPERAVAVINGQSLQVGELFEGYKLVKIESTKVLLKKKQKQIVLHRSGTGLKKAFSSRDVAKGSQP
ncbi:hypothetical protein N9063_00745 [Deltaproteobacteria bacterium]|nr:hypothetical protein [Deltaproteobacteria bacterium]